MRLRFLLFLLLAAMAAYGIFWWRLAGDAKDAAAAFLERLDERGVTAKVAAIDSGGFPYRLALTLRDLHLRSAASTPPFALAAERVAIFTHPWTPDHFVAGTTTVSGSLGRWVYEAASARASWLRTPHDVRMDSDLRQLALGASDDDDSPVTVERAQIHVRIPMGAGDEDAGPLLAERADIALRLDGIILDEIGAGAPEGRIAHVDLRLEVHGALAFPPTADGLAAWRDAGGTLEITGIDVDWGPVRVTGSGSLALDEAFRPLGALALHVARPDLLIAYLVRQGVIAPGTAAAARQLAETRARSNGKGGGTLPLSLQEGQLLLDTLPIAALAPLVSGDTLTPSRRERRRTR
ncbi:MAG: DUF2125 domain-containing protein [Rhodothalassiaceae bacterium]